MKSTDPDPLSLLAVRAKTCEQAQVRLADRSAEILLPAVGKYHDGWFVEGDEILGNYFAERFHGDVLKYDITRGMSWRSFLFSSFRFSMLDFFRRRESSPTCNYHRRHSSTRVQAVSTETVLHNDRSERDVTIGDNIADHRSYRTSDEADFFARIKSISNTRTRLVFILLYVEDLTMREVGESIGVSESSVSVIHKAGLKKLAKDLSQSP